MNWKEIALLVVVISAAFPGTRGRSSLRYSPFNCGGATWELNFTNSAVMSKHMMDWLLHWQFDCSGKAVYREAAHVGGLGSSFMFASKYFMEGIEYRSIFRPDHGNVGWKWANPNAANCTLHKQSYDCFSEPISDCQYAPPDVTRPDSLSRELSRIASAMADNPLASMGAAPNMDVCTFARVAQKPVKWVHGHLMWYLLRPRAEFAAIIEQRTREVLRQAPRGTLSLAMQVRSGPLDDGRTPITNLTDVVRIIDAFVAEKEATHPHAAHAKVGIVFLSSDLPEVTFRSADFMNAQHPRSFRWVTAHHVSIVDGANADAEAYINAHHGQLDVTREDLFVDFMTDVEVLASADYVLGAKSNVYMVAAALRMMRQQPQYQFPRNTCYVDYGGSERWQFVCEGDEAHRATWRYYFNPEYTQFEPYPTAYAARRNRTHSDAATHAAPHHHRRLR